MVIDPVVDGIDAVLFDDVEALRSRGPTAASAAWAERIAAPRLLQRCLDARAKLEAGH